jgi:hypothetical protein
MDRLSSLSTSALRLRFGLSLSLELQPHALFAEQTNFIQAIENQVWNNEPSLSCEITVICHKFYSAFATGRHVDDYKFYPTDHTVCVVNTVQRENSPAQLRRNTGSLLTPNLGRSNFPKFGKQWTVNILNYLWNPTVLFKPQEA